MKTTSEATGLLCAHCSGEIVDLGYKRENWPVELLCCSEQCVLAFDNENLTWGRLNNLLAVLKFPEKDSDPKTVPSQNPTLTL